MYEIPIELILGLIFVAVVLLVPYMPKKKITVSFNKLNLNFSRKKREEKLKEIDKKLEEVLSEGGKEKLVKLEEATEEAAKKFDIKDDLLSEMQTSNASTITANNSAPGIFSEPKMDELSLPKIEGLEDMGEIEKEVKLEQKEQAEETKVEFDDSDKFLEDIAREVEMKEEEQLDLLRDLKGQKFVLEELEAELKEILERAKRLKA
jgi:hypothetical protein